MKLITKELEKKLATAGYYGKTAIMKLFCPWGAATFVITGRDPDEPDMLYGVVDLGMGCVEAGPIYLPELTKIVGPFGLKIERDLHFTGGQTIEELLKRDTLTGI